MLRGKNKQLDLHVILEGYISEYLATRHNIRIYNWPNASVEHRLLHL